jgi:hypothetical protein
MKHRYLLGYMFTVRRNIRREQWPHDIRHKISSLAQTLRSWIRIPIETWMCVHVSAVLTLSCVRSSLPTGWSPAQEILPTVWEICRSRLILTGKRRNVEEEEDNDDNDKDEDEIIQLESHNTKSSRDQLSRPVLAFSLSLGGNLGLGNVLFVSSFSVEQDSSRNNADEGDWTVLINRHSLTPEYDHQMYEVRGQTL